MPDRSGDYSLAGSRSNPGDYYSNSFNSSTLAGPQNLEEMGSGAEMSDYFFPGSDDRWDKYFAPAPKNLLDMVNNGFGDYRNALVDQLRSSYVPKYIMENRRQRNQMSLGGVQSSGFHAQERSTMLDQFRSSINRGMFGIEQDVMGKEQEAKSLLDAWMDSQRKTALQIGSMR